MPSSLCGATRRPSPDASAMLLDFPSSRIKRQVNFITVVVVVLMLGIELKVSHILSTCSNIELYSSP
jgi:hypothetical protein